MLFINLIFMAKTKKLTSFLKRFENSLINCRNSSQQICFLFNQWYVARSYKNALTRENLQI